jgi:hypothetical protein
MANDQLFPEFSTARRIGVMLSKLPAKQQASVVRWINERFPERAIADPRPPITDVERRYTEQVREQFAASVTK